MFNFRNGLFALVVLTAVFAVGRVVMSFAFIASAVGVTLAQAGDPAGAMRVGQTLADGVQGFAQYLAPTSGRQRVYSVLDVPSEIEALRKSRGVRYTGGGAAIIPIGE